MTVAVPVDELPEDPIMARRREIHAIAARKLARRNATSSAMLGVSGLCLAATGAVLIWIVYELIDRGAHWLSIDFFTQVPQFPTILHPDAVGGISTALAGSLVIDALAVAMAVPIGILGGLFLAEHDGRMADVVRRITEVMTGIPSILFGVFVYGIMILKFNLGVAGIDGSVALAILMMPIVMKSSEVAFRAVPNVLSEAGLALGLSKGIVSRRIVVPSATPGLLTSALLATSRAVGETAPLLWLIGNTYVLQWSPLKQQVTLPMSIYTVFSNGLGPVQQDEAWGTALVLAVLVLILNLGSRAAAAFLQRERR